MAGRTLGPMIFGLPLGAWILLFLAVGLGLGLELAFVRSRWRVRRAPGAAVSDSEGHGAEEPRGVDDA
ncbi:MAG TPA: hypothetical protein VLA09_08520 [Longimicrobiales bacterium]|nr:hypothetical protein [Longimicrobiales bacterium]